MNAPHPIFVAVSNMKKGFTLIEIILYVGIISIIFAAIVPFALVVINNGAKSAIQQEISGNARL